MIFRFRSGEIDKFDTLAVFIKQLNFIKMVVTICNAYLIVDPGALITIYVSSGILVMLLIYTMVKLRSKATLVNILIVMFIVTNICNSWWQQANYTYQTLACEENYNEQ